MSIVPLRKEEPTAETTELAAEAVAAEAVHEAEELVATAEAFPVATQDDYNDAAEELKRIKGKAKEIETMRVSITKPLLDAKKRVDDLFRRPLDLLSRAESAIKKGMNGFLAEVERKRREEEALRRKEEERLAKLAAKAEEAGKDEKANLLRAQATAVAVAPPVSEAPKVAGISTRTVWKYRITDATLVPREYLMVDEVKIGKVVQALKETTLIPGVEAYSEQVIAAGSR